LGLAVGGGADLVEVCGGLGLMGGLAFFEVCGAGLGLAAGGGLDFFSVAGAFVVGEVGAGCAEEAPRLPMADADAWATLLDA
jgi:hypothetical protein